MSKTTHEFVQGSESWHAHRRAHLNASDCAAMLGLSPYKTREQLVREVATGFTPEVAAATQERFDRGHQFEALAMPWAEELVGDSLYPATMSAEIEGLPLSASFDGIDMLEEVTWEHKTANAVLLEYLDKASIPEPYCPQLEQGLMISGASRCLFMASTGDKATMQYAWYESDPALRARIIAGWRQFRADVAAYTPTSTADPAPSGKAPETLPALRIEVTGMVTASNLAEFKATALAAIGNVNRDLKTDLDFANAEKAVKWCGDIEDRLAAAKQHALSQTATIDALFKAIDDIGAEARRTRLDLDKLVKARKESIRVEILSENTTAFKAYMGGLNRRLGKPYMPAVPVDFAGAMKGKKTVSSLREACANVMANGKIAANDIADRIQMNLASMAELAGDHRALFPDTAALVLKANDDFVALVKTRIAEHQAAEQRKADALAEQARERIRAEEADKVRKAQEAEDNLIADIWKGARRIEGDRLGYIQKAIIQFETVARNFSDDPRPRVAAAVAEARAELQTKLEAAQQREAEAAKRLEQATESAPAPVVASTVTPTQPEPVAAAPAAPVVVPIRTTAPTGLRAWETERGRIYGLLEGLTLAELQKVSQYIAHREWETADAA